MRLFQLLSLAAAAAPALADTHYFFSGFFSGSTIVGVEFDDQTHSLTLKNNITTDASAGSKWIALDSRLKNLYVGTTGYFQSYSITDDLGLSYSSNVSLPSGCSNANFIASSTAAPYTVFGTPYGGGCSSLAITVDESGVLQEATANVTYDSAAGVHGTSLSPQNDFIYSADDMGNAVWVHSYDNTTGEVEEVQYLAAAEGSNPRHLAVHPNGNWVYVVYEEANSIASYKRDTTTGKLTFTNTTYSLLPSGYTNTSSYWADEVLFSIPSGNASAAAAPKYLLAATRSRTVGVPGYVSAFALDGASGAVTEQLFLLPTTNSGGSANAVSPAPFSEDYFAITDSGSNFLEVWKIDAAGASVTASAVAHLGLASGPANVVWYS
ncbi:Carboxy-cis,cis-muconate cyclase [Colletotrichum higginsianum IMI 349063]|uniref:Carboxy-cis,cis-muconate cyclase n=2 Tax=Colletotrichum higginsianum TaxID=80884 RepID=A0A1B7YL75_COLHI|nr:Carboxy-cis,cis-muconate cyclase [Colletotrichum higginsianum IMI 349063]OBR12712.1 Carboxy-cis,cis-muconate cyclase [Colletotrichum higginsianum IMI 349063]TIC98841.1 Carboxy-cis,cis-muconate cyclase [Colletotrichum higginsianum]